MSDNKDRVSFSTYVPLALARRIEREAREQDRSVSNVIKLALLRYYSDKPAVEYRDSAL